MFEDSILKPKSKQGSAAMVSVVVQLIIVGVLILIPLIYTEALPKGVSAFMIAPPPPPPPPPPPAAAVKVIKVVSEIQNNQLRMPTKIPQKIQMVKEDTAPPEAPDSGVIGGVGGGTPGGVIGGFISSTPIATVKAAAPSRVRISGGVAAGQLITRVNPVYPPLARSARVAGTVMLSAIIGKDGTIQNLKVISGHPMLTQAALDAVKQWRYKPYLLNGEPVEVDTQVQVNFTLSGG